MVQMLSLVNLRSVRVKDILTKNPWLGGWLMSDKGIGSLIGFVMIHPVSSEAAPKIFQEFEYSEISGGRSTEFVEYENILDKSSALVKNNLCIINQK